MIGVSGGRDSTYTLWKAVHDYGMKVLAIHYDNPFTSPTAYKNMKRASEILDIDVIRWSYPNDAHMKSTRKVLKVWAKKPSASLISLNCTYCKTLWPNLVDHARNNNISLYIIGSNPLETAAFKQKSMGGARTYHKFSNIPKILKTILKELLANPYYLTNCSWSQVLQMYLYASHSSPFSRWRFKDITILRLFDYLRWDINEVESTITKNLEWEKSPEVEATWRFDCRLDYVRRMMYYRTLGVTELRDLYSKMIRENMITRDEVLKRLEKEEIIPEEVINNVLEPLGMTFSDFHFNKI
ncbi:MAG: hypothetical protein ACFFDN_16930 [Candidatus Hodarchaeota archaeon]